MKTLGIGGVFIRVKNIEESKKWYKDVLDVNIEEWNGACFIENNETIFSLFNKENDYFPTNQDFMLNFRIDSMDEFIDKLNNLNIIITRPVEVSEYGKFVWITDPDNRLVEVWEK